MIMDPQSCQLNTLVDPIPLSAKYRGSFAYKTIKDRLPPILTHIIDGVHRDRHEIASAYGEKSGDDVKNVCNRLVKLRYEIQTDKSLQEFVGDLTDIQLWNSILKEQNPVATSFSSPWLLVECHMYRKVYEAFTMSTYLTDYDPFRKGKEDQFYTSSMAVHALASFVESTLEAACSLTVEHAKQLLSEFIEVSLWGNKCDLSISAGLKNSQEEDVVSQLAPLRQHIICNHTDALTRYVFPSQWQSPQKRDGDTEFLLTQVDIILDNAGFELVADLCFAEFLLCAGIARRVRFHGKRMPWFVSDVIEADFLWTVRTLGTVNHREASSLAQRWAARLQDGDFSYTTHDFWTSPLAFADMRARCPDLYDELGKSDLLIFKGDLNHRKLLGDLAWPTTTDFGAALRGFRPAPLVTLRTLKADLVTGLPQGKAEELAAVDPDWMVSGNYGVIQFAG